MGGGDVPNRGVEQASTNSSEKPKETVEAEDPRDAQVLKLKKQLEAIREQSNTQEELRVLAGQQAEKLYKPSESGEKKSLKQIQKIVQRKLEAFYIQSGVAVDSKGIEQQVQDIMDQALLNIQKRPLSFGETLDTILEFAKEMPHPLKNARNGKGTKPWKEYWSQVREYQLSSHLGTRVSKIEAAQVKAQNDIDAQAQAVLVTRDAEVIREGYQLFNIPGDTPVAIRELNNAYGRHLEYLCRMPFEYFSESNGESKKTDSHYFSRKGNQGETLQTLWQVFDQYLLPVESGKFVRVPDPDAFRELPKSERASDYTRAQLLRRYSRILYEKLLYAELIDAQTGGVNEKIKSISIQGTLVVLATSNGPVHFRLDAHVGEIQDACQGTILEPKKGQKRRASKEYESYKAKMNRDYWMSHDQPPSIDAFKKSFPPELKDQLIGRGEMILSLTKTPALGIDYSVDLLIPPARITSGSQKVPPQGWKLRRIGLKQDPQKGIMVSYPVPNATWSTSIERFAPLTEMTLREAWNKTPEIPIERVPSFKSGFDKMMQALGTDQTYGKIRGKVVEQKSEELKGTYQVNATALVSRAITEVGRFDIRTQWTVRGEMGELVVDDRLKKIKEMQPAILSLRETYERDVKEYPEFSELVVDRMPVGKRLDEILNTIDREKAYLLVEGIQAMQNKIEQMDKEGSPLQRAENIAKSVQKAYLYYMELIKLDADVTTPVLAMAKESLVKLSNQGREQIREIYKPFLEEFKQKFPATYALSEKPMDYSLKAKTGEEAQTRVEESDKAGTDFITQYKEYLDLIELYPDQIGSIETEEIILPPAIPVQTPDSTEPSVGEPPLEETSSSLKEEQPSAPLVLQEGEEALSSKIMEQLKTIKIEAHDLSDVSLRDNIRNYANIAQKIRIKYEEEGKEVYTSGDVDYVLSVSEKIIQGALFFAEPATLDLLGTDPEFKKRIKEPIENMLRNINAILKNTISLHTNVYGVMEPKPFADHILLEGGETLSHKLKSIQSNLEQLKKSLE